MSKPEYFIVIDGHALIYRAFHAFPALSTHTGQLVNAVYGFSRHVLTAIRDFDPTYIAVAFDHPKPTFRHTDFAEYKGTRAPMPDELRSQIPLIKEVVTALNIPQFELEGYEADDLIGTLSCQLTTHESNLMTIIVTGDRDTFQLVNDTTHVWLPGRGKGNVDKEYDREGVKERMGVFPEQVVDLKALMGDASDNIPGVKGIGEKTAVTLMQTFGTLDKVYQAAESTDQIMKESVRTKLLADKENAYLSRKLATIECASPIQVDLEACRVSGYDKQKVCELFDEMDFKSLKQLLPPDEFELGLQGALF